MSLHPNDDDAAVGWEEARWLVGKGKAGLRYEPPINTCTYPGCNMPTSGMMCLSCATR